MCEKVGAYSFKPYFLCVRKKMVVLRCFVINLLRDVGMKFVRIFFEFLINKVYRIKLLPATLVVLLMLSVFVGISSQALTFFHEHKKSIYKNMELSVDRFRYFLRISINNLIIGTTATAPVLDSQLKSFYITIDREKQVQLNANLPKSGKERYYKAYLKIEKHGDVRPIKLRYRGDHLFHWMYPQKSLRIKLKKKDLYDMQRKMNLVNPPRMEGYVLDSVSYELARELGIIAPDFYPVRTFINGEYMGVYTFLSQTDESLLRKHKRMPGSIYAGDMGAARTKEGVSELWFDQRNWKKVAARNAEQKYNREDILLYLDAANNFSGLEFSEFFNSMMEKEKYYAFMALDVIFGSSHHDYNHNQKIYFDPYLGKFEPIEWDVRYWSKSPDKDESLYPMLEQMKLNPVLEYERDKVAYGLLNDGSFYDGIHKKIDKYHALVLPDLKADPYRDYAEGSPHGYFSKRFSISMFEESIENLHKTIDARKQKLQKIYRDSKSSYTSRQTDNVLNLLFKVQGNSPIRMDLSNFPGNPDALVYRDMNFNGKLDEQDSLIVSGSIETLFPGRKKTDANRKGALKVVKGPYSIINAPLYYSYLLLNVNKQLNQPIAAVNAITGQQIVVPHEEKEINPSEVDSIHPWSLPRVVPKQYKFSGEVEVRKDLIFTEKDSVRIEPGTRFIMYPGASVYFYGEVHAAGTKVQPISFEAKDVAKPWGSVVVQGQATSGSHFDHVEFSNGSVTSRNLINYTAQFNIHDTSEFKVTNCKIGPNHIGDDSMHIAYSKGLVDRCLFYSARSDALDIDISTVTVSNSLFINSGNDSLDLMTADALVVNNLFINAGDKGISTGEWSTGEYTNNLFYNCLIGLEVKDKSVVHAKNLIIVNSKEKAINLYNKNLRYDEGGTLISDKVVIVGNQVVSADERSTLKVSSISKEAPRLSNNLFITDVLGMKSESDSAIGLIQQVERHYE
jgi:hypothetical protein